MQLFPECLFLKSASGKKQRIKAQQSQKTQDALVSVCPPLDPQEARAGWRWTGPWMCCPWAITNWRGAKPTRRSVLPIFLRQDQNCAFFPGEPQPPPVHTSPTPASLPDLLQLFLLSFIFKCFAAVKGVIPATCPTWQPVPPSSPKAHHINKSCATAGWGLPQAATVCTLSMGWKGEADQKKALNIFYHEHQVMDRILDPL